VRKVYRENEIVDGFNLIYIWLRWPTYWILGIVLLIIVSLLGKIPIRKYKDDTA
jgi:hypothetical protein